MLLPETGVFYNRLTAALVIKANRFNETQIVGQFTRRRRECEPLGFQAIRQVVMCAGSIRERQVIVFILERAGARGTFSF